jgi:hypothetical protein
MKYIHDCHCYLCNVTVKDELKHVRTRRHRLKFNEIINYFIELEQLYCLLNDTKISVDEKIEVVNQMN